MFNGSADPRSGQGNVAKWQRCMNCCCVEMEGNRGSRLNSQQNIGRTWSRSSLPSLLLLHKMSRSIITIRVLTGQGRSCKDASKECRSSPSYNKGHFNCGEHMWRYVQIAAPSDATEQVVE